MCLCPLRCVALRCVAWCCVIMWVCVWVCVAFVSYQAFDRNSDGIVSYDELAAGLSVFCSGSTDDKVAAAFALYDKDQDGFVSKVEMQFYLASVFRIMFHLNPAFEATNGMSASQLAAETTERAFADCDLNHDEKLSFDEVRGRVLSLCFMCWVLFCGADCTVWLFLQFKRWYNQSE